MIRRRGLREASTAFLLLGLLMAPCQAADVDNDVMATRIKKDLTYIASDACEGRGVSTKGINLAADYIVEQFKKIGLQPGGVENSYFQPFTMHGSAKLGTPNTLAFHGPLGQDVELTQDQQFKVMGMSGSGAASGPIVFVGFGVTGTKNGYDDYMGVDIAGKIVMLLRKTPRTSSGPDGFDGQLSNYHASLVAKMDNAASHNAAAILVVNDRETASNADPLLDFGYSASSDATAPIPAVHLRRTVADSLVRTSLGKSLKEIEEEIDFSLKPQSTELKGWTAKLKTSVERNGIQAKNIIGVLPGSGPLANEIVIIGAHYDHLGYGGFGSLARNLKEPAIHHGADDNGSGTTLMIELSRHFAAMPNRQGRKLVFMAFSGEESGLIGSAYYCKNPLFPLADTAAMINLDMVGRLRADTVTKKDKLIVYGTGSARGFNELVDSLNKRFEFQFQKNASGMGPSDQQSFYLKDIPVLFFFTDTHADYHRPSDTVEKINFPGMVKIGEFVEQLASALATVTPRPVYVKAASGSSSGAAANASGSPHMAVPSVGIRPSYADEGPGVLLDGVSEGRPAAKAGIQGGDRIVEILGKPCNNMETYMTLMRGVKRGDTVEFTILRGGQKLKVKIETEK
ncbi:MAG TPA: M28 family peptidase [Gemmataceae bacterium]|jgi:Zn-dependent M28 family amino/carboxypeptidase|nr:M28 family peptidase [Gemmataceae bacterium]